MRAFSERGLGLRIESLSTVPFRAYALICLHFECTDNGGHADKDAYPQWWAAVSAALACVSAKDCCVVMLGHGTAVVLVERCTPTEAERAARLVRNRLMWDFGPSKTLLCAVTVDRPATDPKAVLAYAHRTSQYARWKNGATFKVHRFPAAGAERIRAFLPAASTPSLRYP